MSTIHTDKTDRIDRSLITAPIVHQRRLELNGRPKEAHTDSIPRIYQSPHHPGSVLVNPGGVNLVPGEYEPHEIPKSAHSHETLGSSARSVSALSIYDTQHFKPVSVKLHNSAKAVRSVRRHVKRFVRWIDEMDRTLWPTAIVCFGGVAIMILALVFAELAGGKAGAATLASNDGVCLVGWSNWGPGDAAPLHLASGVTPPSCPSPAPAPVNPPCTDPAWPQLCEAHPPTEDAAINICFDSGSMDSGGATGENVRWKFPLEILPLPIAGSSAFPAHHEGFN